MAVRTEKTLAYSKGRSLLTFRTITRVFRFGRLDGVMESASYLVTLGNKQAAPGKSFLERIASLLGNQHGISIAQTKPPEVL